MRLSIEHLYSPRMVEEIKEEKNWNIWSAIVNIALSGAVFKLFDVE